MLSKPDSALFANEKKIAVKQQKFWFYRQIY